MQPPDKRGLAGVRPIFIIGAPRSGTSVTTWALGQHPNIQAMPETGWIASMGVGSFLSWRKGSERGRFSHLSNADYPAAPFLERIGESIDRIVSDVFDARCQRMYGDFRATGELRHRKEGPRHPLQLMRSVDDPKRRWIDGTPLNSQYLWILRELFPHARYLHNLRRPDAVATSLEGFANVGADPQPLEDGLRTWIQHTENAWFAERAFGADRVHRVDFERIGAEPEALVREVLGFLDEPFDANCLLPLRKRLNSSEVDDRREENLARLRELEVFMTAEALHDQIVAAPVPSEPDPAALEVLRQRFHDYCHERSLV